MNKRWKLLLVMTVWAGIAAVVLGVWRRRAVDEGLQAALPRRGALLWFGGTKLRRYSNARLKLRPAAEIAGIAALLQGGDEPALVAALRRHQLDGVLVERPKTSVLFGGAKSMPVTESRTLAQRLQRYDAFENLRGRYFSSIAGLYLVEAPLAVSADSLRGLAEVARAILQGAAPPRLADFPERLRRSRRVEVMVMLRHQGEARLWRSARADSLAAALLTAAQEARRRWQQRQVALGGDLLTSLPELDVEVQLLRDDGAIGSRNPSFFELAFGRTHGVAYEHRGAWHYLLPEATWQGASMAERWGTDGAGSQRLQGPTVLRAYERLLRSQGLTTDSYRRDDLRLYRLLSQPLSTSPAISAVADAPTPPYRRLHWST